MFPRDPSGTWLDRGPLGPYGPLFASCGRRSGEFATSVITRKVASQSEFSSIHPLGPRQEVDTKELRSRIELLWRANMLSEVAITRGVHGQSLRRTTSGCILNPCRSTAPAAGAIC